MSQPVMQLRQDKASTRVSLLPRPFETEMLGMPAAQLDIEGVDNGNLSPAISAALDQAARAGTRLVSCRRPDSDIPVIGALQDAGFRVIECLVTLQCELPHRIAKMPERVRLATRTDADAVAAIASSSFRHDRFHADPKVSDEAADRLKGAWARNAVNGRADAVFVTEDTGTLTGFNACLVRGDTAVIDLIGVANGAQRRGFGRDLVAASLAHYAGKAQRMIVGTQSANQASLALYEAAGFRVKSAAFTLHAHLH
jgi:ribosomal protein S18 acetylase RimI-like enzyme